MLQHVDFEGGPLVGQAFGVVFGTLDAGHSADAQEYAGRRGNVQMAFAVAQVLALLDAGKREDAEATLRGYATDACAIVAADPAALSMLAEMPLGFDPQVSELRDLIVSNARACLRAGPDLGPPLHPSEGDPPCDTDPA